MRRGIRDALITLTISGVTVLSVFLVGSTTVTITVIGKGLKFRQEDLQWPLNTYTLSYGCLLLLCGRVADIIGSRKVFIVGSAWFTIWSLAAAFAPNPWTFIFFFALQGIGSAATVPAGISIISSYFPPGKAKNRAFAILGAGQPIGYFVGMILGGILAQSKASWRAIFWFQSALGFGLCAMAWFVLPADQEAKRYAKGLDWFGAFLSTAGLGLLVYDLGQSTSAPKGWATPFVPSLLGTSIILIVLFVLWELHRESKGLSVLVPMSIWSQPRARMGPMMLLVLFAWWGFNCQGYFFPLFFQEVLQLSPLQTAVRLIPGAISGVIANVIAGYVVSFVPGQIIVVVGIVSCMASCVVFALIKVHAVYWAMAFVVTITLPVLDVAYTIANMHVCSSFSGDSQALAGSIFSVATRLGTSIGLAVTSSVANSVSQKYNHLHPDLSPTDPTVLMPGFRAAAWTNLGSLGIGLLIAIVGMRGIGIVGQPGGRQEKSDDVEMVNVIPTLIEPSPEPLGEDSKSSNPAASTKGELVDSKKAEIITEYEV